MNQAQALDMSDAPSNVMHMSKMIQVRNVPDELHRALKTRAAAEGMTLSDYIKRELGYLAGKSKLEEVAARVQARGRSGVRTESVVDILRESRGD